MYFSLSNGVFKPFRGQSKVLDKKFMENVVVTKNIANYNEYTNSIISKSKNGDYFYSDKFSYDASNFTFNFFELHKCESESDFQQMYASMSIFDETKSIIIKDIETSKTFFDKISTEYPCPSIDNSGFYVDLKNWQFIVRNILKKKNTILMGPTGTGKTELILLVSKMLGLDCKIYDMGAMQDPLTDLLGSHRIENGSSIFDYAKFVNDVQKPGIILLDELSRAPQMAMNILFPCLDYRRELPIDIAAGNGVRNVKIHKDCVFVAPANIGAEYSGTNDIDIALMNRFLPVQIDYMPNEKEIDLIINRTGIEKNIAESLMTMVSFIRSCYNKGQLSKSMSTRESIACAELIYDGFNIYDAINYIYLQKFINTGSENEQTKVKSMLLAAV